MAASHTAMSFTPRAAIWVATIRSRRCFDVASSGVAAAPQENAVKARTLERKDMATTGLYA